MNTYKCAPEAVVSTSIDAQGTELSVVFDKDGLFSTENFHLIAVLDQMASDPRSPITAANASSKKATRVEEPTTTEEDEV